LTPRRGSTACNGNLPRRKKRWLTSRRRRRN